MSEILEVPNAWRAGVITNKGLGLLSKLVKGHTLAITRAETGAGYVDPDLLAQQTAVSEPMQALTFSTVSYPEEGKCVIPCRLSNEEITTSYIARQIGLYAMDPDEGEILFYITQVEKEDGGTGIPSKKLIPSYTSTWNLVILYGMADGVTLEVDPADTVSRDEMHDYVDSAMNEVADKVGFAIKRRITIPAGGDWVESGSTGEDGYAFVCTVPMEESNAEYFPTMALDIPSLKPAAEAGLCPTIETLDGAIRFWAQAIPAEDLEGTILLRSENMITLSTATDQEVSDVVKDIFGASGGGELPVYEIATDEEVRKTAQDIFG
nr:MAG TPA: tail-collar fiber protein [Caudoviricetes sp.]